MCPIFLSHSVQSYKSLMVWIYKGIPDWMYIVYQLVLNLIILLNDLDI